MSVKIDWGPSVPYRLAPPARASHGHRRTLARLAYALERRVGVWSELTGVIRATGLAAGFFALVVLVTFPFVTEAHDTVAALVLAVGLVAVAAVCLLLPTWSLSLALAHVAVIGVVVLEAAYLGIADGLAGPYVGGFVPLVVAVSLFASRRMVAATMGLIVAALVALALAGGVLTRAEVASVVSQAATAGATAFAVSTLATRQRRTLRRTERRLHDQRSRSQAYRSDALVDPLTGLGNRRAFERDLARLAMDRGGFTVVIADADGLKHVNDELGHRAGDAFLGSIADALATLLRAGDLAYRIGGDEFALLVRGHDEAAIARRVGNRLELDVPQVGVASAALGVASTSDGRSGREAFLLADRRMYEHKAARRDTSDGLGRD